MKLVEKFRTPWGSPPLTEEQAKRAREDNEARFEELRRGDKEKTSPAVAES